MRVDVDFSLSNVEEFAELLLSSSHSCTFFFLVSSETYNLQSKSGRTVLRNLDSMGVEIGLHFDASLYDLSDPLLIGSGLNRERVVLEDLLEKAIDSFSFHNPSLNGLTQIKTDLLCSYDYPYFQKDFYRSDSRMSFPLDLKELIQSSESQPLFQLLLHPEHYGDSAFDYVESARRELAFHKKQISQTLSVNSTASKLLKNSDF